ncbi:Cytochrome P450 4c3 [Orchesella cincta]|uniref:Cytochrome P450 4c3 n=1 Tax=Orchesella cincta TaxID=48709 RepID=A0A1D2MPP6_ORCCI|nr:Cytochrome P450 4c3 [Orchesella cincta]
MVHEQETEEPCCSSLSSVILTLSIAVGAYFLLRRNPRYKRMMNQLGGPPPLPVLGNVLYFLRPHEEYLIMMGEWIEKYGTVFGVWIGNFIPYIFVADPNCAEKLLSTMNHIDKGKYDYSLLYEWLGTGLLTATRSKWSSRRKMLTPSFHFKILEDFMPVFNEQATILLDCLDKKESTGKSFDIFPYITRCTLDIICETAMGKRINTQTSSINKDYFEAVNGMCELILQKNTQPWLRFPPIYYMSSVSTRERAYLKKLKGFTLSVIKSKKADREKQKSEAGNKKKQTDGDSVYGKERKTFLDLLLDASENGDGLTDADMREEVDTFMFEGHDTTAANLGWTTMLLAAHPECQKKVQDELEEIFQDDPTRDVSTADVAKMKYLECCVKESLRLYPSVPLIMRQVDYDFKLDDGRVIPKGSTAMIAIYFNHRHPDHFPEPLKFKPERFLIENTTKRHPYCYVPFSAGPRNCIGQKFALLEEKVVLAKLFRTYWMKATEKMEDVIPVPDVILRPKNGVNVALYKRT